jgi:hypothetical protein
MPRATFYFLISDAVQAEIALDEANARGRDEHGAQDSSSICIPEFPPPENISITISDAARLHVATLKLSFEIHYGAGVVK